MSLIQIDKKAITESDANGILEQTYALKNPLGIPTLYLRPEDFIPPSNASEREQHTILQSRMEHLIKSEFINKETLGVFYPMYGETLFPDDFGKFLAEGHLKSQKNNFHEPCARVQTILLFEGFAHSYKPLKYKDPIFNIIDSPEHNLSENNFVNFSNGVVGTPSQWQYYVLWHEIAHGVGADEGQADAISAVMCRKAFDDCSFLSVMADFRVANTVENYNNTSNQDRVYGEQYGFPLSEVIDYVVSLPQ